MSDEIDSDYRDDIYGKIDALLDKRAGFVNGAKPKVEWDFPLLTDVVDAATATAPISGSERHGQDDARHAQEHAAEFEFDLIEAPSVARGWSAEATPDEVVQPVEVSPLVIEAEASSEPAAEPGEIASPDWEDRLAELLKAQEDRLEARLRQIVREELERLLGRP